MISKKDLVMQNTSSLAMLFAIYVFLVSLVVAVLPAENVHTDNIVVVLDASGSMEDKFSSDPTQTRMDAAKEALQAVLTTIPDGTNIGLLVFSGSNVNNHWVYPLGPKDNEVLTKAINSPFPGGKTPLGKYLKIGANRLLEQREKQYNYGSYRLLVVTDGEATDRDKVQAYTPEIMHKQIRIDVIGVDMKKKHMLATVVDSYRRADDPKQLIKAVSDVLAEVTSTRVDSRGEDIFELISPLTEELALSLIVEITKVSGNEPIGKQLATPGHPPKMDTPNPSVNASTNQPSNSQDSNIGLWIIIIIISLSIITWLVVKKNQGNSKTQNR